MSYARNRRRKALRRENGPQPVNVRVGAEPRRSPRTRALIFPPDEGRPTPNAAPRRRAKQAARTVRATRAQRLAALRWQLRDQDIRVTKGTLRAVERAEKRRRLA